MDSGPRDPYGEKLRVTVTKESVRLTHVFGRCHAMLLKSDSFPERWLLVQVIDRPTGLTLRGG